MRLVTTAGLFQDLWVASLYRGTKGYDTKAVGPADDTTDANGTTVFDPLVR